MSQAAKARGVGARGPEAPELPGWVCIGLPVGFLLLQHGVYLLDPRLYQRVFEGELGVIELGTALLAFAAAGMAGACLRRRARFPSPQLALWVAAVGLAALYFGGEEVSWGQQLFAWDTPPFWDRLNDQHETNLHNTSSWFDQKPRLLLEVGILVGGIAYPLTLGRRRPPRPENRSYWLWPTQAGVAAGVIALGVHFLDHARLLHRLGSVTAYIRYSELQELYYAAFLLLYLASIWVRLGRARPGASIRGGQ